MHARLDPSWVQRAGDQQGSIQTLRRRRHGDENPLPVGATRASAFKEVLAALHRAFPDLHVAVEELIAEGDNVVARNRMTGTHEGEYLAVPTQLGAAKTAT